jgi:hypothetical protein
VLVLLDIGKAGEAEKEYVCVRGRGSSGWGWEFGLCFCGVFGGFFPDTSHHVKPCLAWRRRRRCHP